MPGPTELKVAVWNVNAGFRVDGQSRLLVEDIHAALSASNGACPDGPADVLGLVEVPFAASGRPYTHFMKTLRVLGFEHFVAHQLSASHLEPSDGIGLMLASRFPIPQFCTYRFPPLSARNGVSGFPAHQKGSIVGTFHSAEHGPVMACVTHLPPFHRFGLGESDAESVKQIQSLAAPFQPTRARTKGTRLPLLVLGDFNLTDRGLIEQKIGLTGALRWRTYHDGF